MIKLKVIKSQKKGNCTSSQERAFGGLWDHVSNLAMLSAFVRKGKIRSCLPATLAFISSLPYCLTEELFPVLTHIYSVKWKLFSGKQTSDFDLLFS